jgi:hypothetical protein
MGLSPHCQGPRPRARSASAGLGQAFLDREEFEMSTFPATTDAEDMLVTAAGYAQLCAELEALRGTMQLEILSVGPVAQRTAKEAA